MTEDKKGNGFQDKPKRTRFVEADPSPDPLAHSAEIIRKILLFGINERLKNGVVNEQTLGLIIAESLSLFVEHYGPEAALGFIGETKQYLDQSLLSLVDKIPYDTDDGPGIIARLEYDPIVTSTGRVNRAMRCIVRSRSGAIYLLDVSQNNATMVPMSIKEATAWVKKFSAEHDAPAIIELLKKPGSNNKI